MAGVEEDWGTVFNKTRKLNVPRPRGMTAIGARRYVATEGNSVLEPVMR